MDFFSRPFVRQVWIVSAVIFIVIGQGITFGSSTSLQQALQAPDSEIKTDLNGVSWLIAALPMAGIVSYFIFPSFMPIYGRRWSMILGLLPSIIGLTISYFATNMGTLITGRMICGLSVGSSGIMGAVAIGEYTSPKYRGVFLAIKTAMLCVGSTIVHFVSNYVHWRTVFLINMVPFAIAIVITFTWPESPAWLADQKRFKECRQAYYWIRGKGLKAKNELNDLIAAQKERPIKLNKTIMEKIMVFLLKFRKNNFWKPVIINVFGTLLLETTGRHVFPAFALQMLNEITGSQSDSIYYTMCIDLTMNVSVIFAGILVKMLRRRILLFISGLSSLATLVSATIYLYLQANGWVGKEYSLVPVILFALYNILGSIGCTPLCLGFVGEIFPLEHRAVGSSIAGCFIGVFMMIAYKVIPGMLISLKIYGTFAIIAVTMTLSLVVLYIMLPETKDKTLQEIDDYFQYGRIVKRNIGDNEEEIALRDMNS